MKRVVITGMGALTPIGNNVPEFWQSLTEGRSGAAPITHFDASVFKTHFACELKGFDITQHLEKNELRRYDPFTQYALVAVEEARQMAGIDFSQLNGNRIGVIWGSGNGGIQTFQDQVLEYAAGNGTPRFNPFFIPRMIVDIAAGVISIRYGLRGPNFATVSACATSNTAIIEAFNYIQWGKADVMVTGGSEAPINQSSVGGFNAARALSTRNDDPATASRPFDPTRDGFVMGEGAGALILESLEHAQQRGATILAEVLGGGMAADAYHLTGTHPDGEGAWLGMQAALEEAGLQPQQIDYINAHATSTDMGDTSELKAVARLFAGHARLAISATKSMTGHLLGAAGAVEAIACIQAIRHNQVPPTANTKEIEAPFDQLFRFPLGQACEQPVNYAMSNTFGFGGHTATVIFGKV
ncbi:MAG: beta-ketoacyl-ACP synthase II [Chitinophagaceae bacterium]